MCVLFSQMMRERQRNAMRNQVFGQFPRVVKYHAAVSAEGELCAIEFLELIDQSGLAMKIKRNPMWIAPH
jgi:hypothetical protein